MSYNLVYTRRAEKDIKKLDPSIKRQLSKAILKLQDNPLEHADKLTDPKIGTYRFKIGDYRVIFDIEGKDIVVLRVGHRKEIYKRH
ncbi:MAG: type II toxin-antitoxin system RelE/ParE family toxin [Candidatus Brocadia sp.]|nr:type II toxin-antitoxin system RelE/ParE family toxin [Candidatus Brocadia sp.]